MSSKFRVLLTTMQCDVYVVDQIIKAITVLHNFLLAESSTKFDPRNLADKTNEKDGLWRNEINPLPQAIGAFRRRGANNYTQKANDIRDTLAQFFSNEGAVDWQDQYL